jgi:LysR family transcriptional regulator, cell division regulator
LALVTGTTTSLIHQVAEHELEGAFVARPVHHQELSEETLFLEDLVLVSPRAVRNFDDLAKVENLKKQSCFDRAVLTAKDSHLFSMGQGIRYVVMEFASLDAIVTCITAG